MAKNPKTPARSRPPVAYVPLAGVRHERRRRWWRMVVVFAATLVLGGAGAQAAIAMRPPTPMLRSLAAPTVPDSALRFSKRVPVDKHLRFTMPVPTAPTLDELTNVMVALQRTEHIRMAPKDTRHLAAAIIMGADRWNIDRLDLTALAWIESRFRPDAISGSGACGMFQQIPRYARPLPTTCARLHDPAIAGWHAGAFIARYQRRWGANWTCHYNGGMVCGPRAWTYAIRHAQVREQVGKALVRLRQTPRWAHELGPPTIAARESARSLLASNRQFLSLDPGYDPAQSD